MQGYGWQLRSRYLPKKGLDSIPHIEKRHRITPSKLYSPFVKQKANEQKQSRITELENDRAKIQTLGSLSQTFLYLVPILWNQRIRKIVREMCFLIGYHYVALADLELLIQNFPIQNSRVALKLEICFPLPLEC